MHSGFWCPVTEPLKCVVVDHAMGHIVVTDYYNHQVHMWCTDDGSFVCTFALLGW
jgi:hypothetical protein